MINDMMPMSGRMIKEDGTLLNTADYLFRESNRSDKRIIYDGLLWTINKLFLSVSDNSYASLRIKAPADKKVELTIIVTTTTKCMYRSYLNSTYSGEGNLLTPFNRKTDVTNTPLTNIYADPTHSVLGPQRADTLIPGTTVGQRVGGTLSDSTVTLLMPNDDLLIRIQCLAAGDVGYTINYVERPIDYIA